MLSWDWKWLALDAADVTAFMVADMELVGGFELSVQITKGDGLCHVKMLGGAGKATRWCIGA